MKHLLLLALCSLMLYPALAQPGSIDLSFDPGTSVETPGAVEAIAIQPDGKIIAVGGFLTYDGNPSKNIVRINTDGSYDDSFQVGEGFTGGSDPAGATGRCLSVAIQPDGKILVGGGFESFNGESAGHCIRLNTDGSRDTSFDIGTGFNNSVQAFAIQPDGKIVVSGLYSFFNGSSVNRILRLNPDGTRDLDFVSPGPDNQLFTLALQPDGKILCGGTFTSYAGVPVGRMVRLNTDGSLDNTFVQGTGFNALVLCFDVLDDGRILVGGGFTEYDGNPRSRIVRLMPDGSIDATFQASIGSGSDQVRAIVEQDDGKYIVLGGFFQSNGEPFTRVVRLLPNGANDSSFDPGLGFSNTVQDALLQPDGKLVAGGYFTAYDDVPRRSLVRVNTSGSAGLWEADTMEFSLYPNPSNGIVTLLGELDGMVDVRVMDASGRLMYESRLQGNGAEPLQVDLGALDAGVYVLQLRAKDGVATRTVVKQ